MESNNKRVYICSDGYDRLAKEFNTLADTERLSANDLEDEEKLSKGNLLLLDFRKGFDKWAYSERKYDEWEHDWSSARGKPDRFIGKVQWLAPNLPIVVLAERQLLIPDYSRLKDQFGVLDVVTEQFLKKKQESLEEEHPKIQLLLSGKEMPRAGMHHLLIEIEWDENKRTLTKNPRAEIRTPSGSFATTYDGIPHVEHTYIPMNRDILETYLKKVREGRKHAFQHSVSIPDVRDIGEQLFKIIFDEEVNKSVAAYYRFCIQKVKSEELTLEFRVKENNPFPFELLCDPSKGFLGTQYKLYRSFQDLACDSDSFQQLDKMRVLLVASKTGFDATGPNGTSVKLGRVINGVETEIEQIRDIMTSAGVKDRNITVLSCNGVKATTRNVLREITEKEWDIVHFAGHSFAHKVPEEPCCEDLRHVSSFHQTHTVAGQIVFEQPACKNPNPKNPFHGDAVCLWRLLEKRPNTKFIYFSSCKSGLDSILTQTIANSETTSALGFLWSVNNKKAHNFAIHFYKKLFESLNIQKKPNNPIVEALWQTQNHFSLPGQGTDTLAPVLISQVNG